MNSLANFSLHELRYIIALAEEKHFGHAAQKCFVSQPTLSIAVKKIEQSLGVTIFERSKTKVLLTEVGQQIIDKAYGIMRTVKEIQDIALTSQDIYAKPLKVGAIYTVGPYLFPNLISNINKSNAKLRLIIEEGFTSQLTTKLLNGDLDAIIVAMPFERPDVLVTELYSEPLDIIIPINHEWSSKQSINPEELSSQRLLLLGQGNCFRDQVLNICPQCTDYGANSDNGMIITSSLETIKYMVANNIGISIMPRSAIIDIKNSNPFIQRKPFASQAPKREIVIAYRVEFPRGKLVHQVADLIGKTFAFY